MKTLTFPIYMGEMVFGRKEALLLGTTFHLASASQGHPKQEVW